MEVEHLARREVLGIAHGTHTGHYGFHRFHLGEQCIITFGRCGNLLLAHHDAFALGTLGKVLPEFFRDEGHEGVEQVEQVVKQLLDFAEGLSVDGLSVGGLHHFQQPAREFVPEEAVHLHQGFAQAVLAVEVSHFGSAAAQFGTEPAESQAGRFGLFGSLIDLPALYQTEGVPDFVAEVAALFAECLVEEDIVAGGGGQHHAHAHAIGTEAGDEVQRVGRIAQLLRHLAAQLVAHDTREVHVAEGHLARVLVAGHNHAGHPEEDDVRTRHQVARRVVVADFLVARLHDAVEERDGPEPRREPRVERVLVLTEVGGGKLVVAALLAGQGHGFFNRFGHYEATRGQVVGGNAVAPPELARDTPVLDVLQPVAVGVLVFGGIELDFVVHDGRQGKVCKVLHLQEPLHGELRFDGHARTLGATDLVVVVLHFFHQSGFLEVDGNLLAHVEAVLPHIHAGGFAQRGIVVEDVDGLEVVLLAEHVVVHVVGGGHLEATRTELDVDIVVLNDGDDAAYEGHDDLLSLEPSVLRVVRVDAHGHVAHDGFGARGGHHGVAALFVLVYHVAFFVAARAVVIGHVVLHVIELRVLFLVNHFFVREGRLGLGVPVHHAYAAVDEALSVEVYKHFDDALGAFFVHGEGRAVPVARSAHLAELLQDDAAVLLRPCPGMLEELLAGEVGLLDALLSQAVHHLRFGGDGGVVGAGHPAGVLAFHAGAAHEDVLDGFVEHVAHVEHTRHVGGRDYHGIRSTPVGFRGEQAVLRPIFVPFALDFLGAIRFVQFHCLRQLIIWAQNYIKNRREAV